MFHPLQLKSESLLQLLKLSKRGDIAVELPCAMVIFREKLAHHECTEHPHIASNVTKMSKKHIFFWNAFYDLLWRLNRPFELGLRSPQKVKKSCSSLGLLAQERTFFYAQDHRNIWTRSLSGVRQQVKTKVFRVLLSPLLKFQVNISKVFLPCSKYPVKAGIFTRVGVLN